MHVRELHTIFTVFTFHIVICKPNFTGRIVRWENTKERYIVRLDSGQEFALRQINLVQQVEGIVLVGLSKPHLNGSKGLIRGWQPDKSRYVVQLSNGTSLAVMPCNVLLPKNTRVLLQGLSNTRQVLCQTSLHIFQFNRTLHSPTAPKCSSPSMCMCLSGVSGELPCLTVAHAPT